jgi:anti-sigma factor RsiW
MSERFANSELEAYLDEALPVAQMTRLEQTLRGNADLRARLAELVARRDAGVHSLGAIWRRHRLSCPARDQLGSYLLGAMEPAESAYVAFHLETIGCRYCQANLEDLKARQQAEDRQLADRRRRYFQSSAGLLRK